MLDNVSQRWAASLGVQGRKQTGLAMKSVSFWAIGGSAVAVLRNGKLFPRLPFHHLGDLASKRFLCLGRSFANVGRP